MSLALYYLYINIYIYITECTITQLNITLAELVLFDAELI